MDSLEKFKEKLPIWKAPKNLKKAYLNGKL